PDHSVLRITAERRVQSRTNHVLAVLMYSTRLKRSADQSSSMATWRTVSNPRLRMTSHPVSRLKSHRYRLDVPFGYANQTRASPSALPARTLDKASTSACRVTKANAKWMASASFGSRSTDTSSSARNSGSKDNGALTTTISP